VPYVIIGRFADFVIKLAKEKKYIQNVFSFLDEMAISADEKIVELLMFGFLECLNSKENYYKDLVKLFSIKTNQRLKETIDHNSIIAN